MSYKIQGDEELFELTNQAVHILNNLRHYTKIWNEVYGGRAKTDKITWENKADEFLKKLGLQYELHQKSAHIKIEVTNKE